MEEIILLKSSFIKVGFFWIIWYMWYKIKLKWFKFYDLYFGDFLVIELKIVFNYEFYVCKDIVLKVGYAC